MSKEQSLQVCRLYRRALKTVGDWCFDSPDIRAFSVAIRRQFEKYRLEADPERIQFLMAATETLLNRTRHSEPYTPPSAVSGNLWERHETIPKQIRLHGYDDFKDTVR